MKLNKNGHSPYLIICFLCLCVSRIKAAVDLIVQLVIVIYFASQNAQHSQPGPDLQASCLLFHIWEEDLFIYKRKKCTLLTSKQLTVQYSV